MMHRRRDRLFGVMASAGDVADQVELGVRGEVARAHLRVHGLRRTAQHAGLLSPGGGRIDNRVEILCGPASPAAS
jgi:hypothetical protein